MSLIKKNSAHERRSFWLAEASKKNEASGTCCRISSCHYVYICLQYLRKKYTLIDLVLDEIKNNVIFEQKLQDSFKSTLRFIPN